MVGCSNGNRLCPPLCSVSGSSSAWPGPPCAVPWEGEGQGGHGADFRSLAFVCSTSGGGEAAAGALPDVGDPGLPHRFPVLTVHQLPSYRGTSPPGSSSAPPSWPCTRHAPRSIRPTLPLLSSWGMPRFPRCVCMLFYPGKERVNFNQAGREPARCFSSPGCPHFGYGARAALLWKDPWGIQQELW